MLKLAGETDTGLEKIETISYIPALQNTGDLEVATKTITAIVEATGVGNADYNCALTLPASSDSRLIVKRIASRLAVTIDSKTANYLFCRVYVDVQDADHLLFESGGWSSAGAQLLSKDTHSGALPTIFNLLKDGSAHTFYFFFWVDAGNAVISVVQLWESVGSTDTGWSGYVYALTHSGLAQMMCQLRRVGSGTARVVLFTKVGSAEAQFFDQSGVAADVYTPGAVLLGQLTTVLLMGSVATDLNYLHSITFVLRSEQ